MSPNLDAILEDVREAVLSAAGERVARIIAYGSRIDGEPRPGSDLDLLVVLFEPEDSRESKDGEGPAGRASGARRDFAAEMDLRAELRRAADAAAPWPVNPWIVGERRFEETREIPGGMTYAPARRGRVLFRHPESPRRYDDLRAREEARREIVRFWIRRADRFLETGRTLLGRGDEKRPAVGVSRSGASEEGTGDAKLEAARNGRWAAEWYLRGYFTARGLDTGKVRDFRDMRRHVAAEDPDLADRLAVADPLSRYPRSFELPGPPEVAVSEEEARDALERAERVGRLVRDRLRGFLDTA